MSSHLHAEVIRTRQNEIAARAAQVRDVHEARATAVRSGRSMQGRLGKFAAVAGVCIAASTAVTMNVASATPRPARASGHVTAKQLALQTRALERRGFVPTSCTIRGTLFRNYATGQSMTLDW
jgi:hypothetical protein